MIGSDIFELMPLIGLYAETHYRFRFFPFSLYYRRQPEIIFDAPIRIEPNQTIPVSLIIKDADKFPVELVEVRIATTCNGQSLSRQFKLDTPIKSPFWHKIFELDVSQLPFGIVSVDSVALVRNRKRFITVHQDNHTGLSHAPLKVLKAVDPLPNLSGWYSGELHCHTSYGTDQVEFGAPLPMYQRTAEAMGLSWVALTDHSYNLDDSLDNYLLNDPTAPKWELLREEAAKLNSTGSVQLIPGEELSCRSDEGRNIHMVILGDQKFLHGTGDDAQDWLKVKSEHSVKNALARIHLNTFAVAGHPFVKIPFLEKLLVNRGEWQSSDLYTSRLDGWQMLNGQWGDEFNRGLTEWGKALDTGRRINIFAGNDAHGNFNRFRQVKLPMVKLWEQKRHLFGRVTTRVKVNDQLSPETIISNLKRGRVIISDGPMVELKVVQNEKEHGSGDEVSLKDGGELLVCYLSTPEFGKVTSLSFISKNRQQKLSIPNDYGGKIKLPLEGNQYIRIEMVTHTESGEEHRAYTNPIWIV